MPALLWLIAVAFAIWLALAAGAYLLQDRLLYAPARAEFSDLTRTGLAPWPTVHAPLGLIAEGAGPPRGTIVVFHGNAGHAGHRAFYAQALAPLGWRVILAEYPGYGPRDGEPGEANLVADATQTIAEVQRRFGEPLVVIGESLGAAVAAGAVAARAVAVDAASRAVDAAPGTADAGLGTADAAPGTADAGLRAVDAAGSGAGSPGPVGITGLILITPWDRLANVAGLQYPWLPVDRLLRDRYESVERLARFGRPIVIVVAAEDRIVPARFGVALHDALAGRKQLVVIDDAGHNDWPPRVDAGWWQAVIDGALGGHRIDR